MSVQHIPTPFRRKSFIAGNTLHSKNLGHNFKASDFHFATPAEKGRNATFPISIFKVKSALDPAKKIISVFHNPFSTFHFIPQKKLHRGERASLKMSWTPSPIFPLHSANPIPLRRNGTLHSQYKIGNGVRPIGFPSLLLAPLPMFLYFT
jgi:hypothetical protein